MEKENRRNLMFYHLDRTTADFSYYCEECGELITEFYENKKSSNLHRILVEGTVKCECGYRADIKLLIREMSNGVMKIENGNCDESHIWHPLGVFITDILEWMFTVTISIIQVGIIKPICEIFNVRFSSFK